MEKKGIISDIQHFSTGDGPGIRTTVFFKGCNLHCEWCHNPETISELPELLFDERRCTGCGSCAAVCGNCAHSVNRGSHLINRSFCSGCGACAEACPAGALTLCGKGTDIDGIMEYILEDREFYASSGGGITLSGGEPLLQADFCRDLAKACKREKLHVLLETAGNVGYHEFEKLIAFIDGCYFDLKAGSEYKYFSATGGSLCLTIENMKRLVSDGCGVTARIPIIPGHNDTAYECLRMADALRLTGVRRVQLLPFHRLGSGKYHALGRTYGYVSSLPPSRESLAPLLEVFCNSGFDTKICS